MTHVGPLPLLPQRRHASALVYCGESQISSIAHTMQPTLTLTDAPEPHMRQAIAAPLIQFNNSRASQPEDYRSLVIVLSNPDTDEILGGLWGATNFAHLHVDLLFVPELLRGTGLGRKCRSRRSAKRSHAVAGEHGWIHTVSATRVLRAPGTIRLVGSVSSCIG